MMTTAALTRKRCVLPPNISFPIDPLLLEEAEQVVTELAERGITVFHNPSFGIMLIGESLASPVPCKNDMDRAYALHAEIAMLFAIRSIKNMATSFTQVQGSCSNLRAPH